MRIALLAQEVSPAYAGGGIGTYTTYLSAGLRELGHDVTVVGRHDGPWTDGGDGVVYAPRIHLPGRGRYPTLADRLEAALEARRAIPRLRPPFDVIEGPDWLAEAALLRRGDALVHARHIHGGHRVLREHAGWLPDRQQRLSERFEARDLARADVVTIASRLSTLLPSGEAIVAGGRLVPIPVPPMDVTPVPAARVVTQVGRVEKRKGPDVLLAAAELVPDVTVRFVGVDTEGYGAAARPGIEFAGPRTDLANVYAETRVVAVPSRYEPFSMVALEALAAGRPVVLSDACGAAEVLTGEHGAFVFPEGDVEALAALLRRLLDDPSPGARGPAYVREHHAPRVAATAKVAVWDEYLSGR